MKRDATRNKVSRAWFLAGCTLAALAIGFRGYSHAPAGAPVAIHFGPAGSANGWAFPARAFFTAPSICAAMLLLQWWLPAIKPSADDLEKKIVSLVFGGVGIVLVVAQTFVFVRAA